MNGKWIAFIVIGIGLSAFTEPDSLKYSGTALDILSGEFYYTEEHEEWRDGCEVTQTHIIFRDNKEQIIVKKLIDYSKSSSSPDFLLEDFRDGYLEGAEKKGRFTQLKYRKNSSKSVQTKLISIPEPAVIDGGFNHFVKEHWSQLMKGDESFSILPFLLQWITLLFVFIKPNKKSWEEKTRWYSKWSPISYSFAA